MIFCARQIQEKSTEQQKPLFFVFYDLEKAFDKVPRTAMWMVLRRLGCPEHFVGLVRALHEGMSGRVFHDNRLTEEFPHHFGSEAGLHPRPYTLLAVPSRYAPCYSA